MNKIIEWLLKIEEMASIVYKEAALLFKDDKELSQFLVSLSEDESSHFDFLKRVLNYLEKNHITIPPEIILSNDLKNNIEMFFNTCSNKLHKGTLTKKELIKIIVETEFSEWNPIFLYVIDTIMNQTKELQSMSSDIQDHQNQVSDFIDKLPFDMKPDKDINQLKNVWENKILIVEDNVLISKLWERILSSIAKVETAYNGEEGLKKVQMNFYNIIISDIDMPLMDGINFYKKAYKKDISLQTRFIFVSGRITEEREEFLNNNKLKYFSKPVDIIDLVNAVKNI